MKISLEIRLIEDRTHRKIIVQILTVFYRKGFIATRMRGLFLLENKYQILLSLT